MNDLVDIFRTAMESVNEIDVENMGTISVVNDNDGFTLLYTKDEYLKLLASNPLFINKIDIKTISYESEVYTNVQYKFKHLNIEYICLARTDSVNASDLYTFINENK